MKISRSIPTLVVMWAAALTLLHSAPEELFEEGSAAFQNGRFPEAIQKFDLAADGFAQAGDADGQAKALGNLAIALHAVGNYRFAFIVLDRAIGLAEDSENEALLSKLRGITGTISTFSRKAKQSEDFLERTIVETREAGDSGALAALLHDYGVMWAGRGEVGKANAAFEEVLQLCENLGQPGLEAKTLVNRAMMYLNIALEEQKLMLLRGPEDFYYSEYVANFEDSLARCIQDLEASAALLPNLQSDYERATVATTLGDCYRTILEKKAANVTKSAEEAVKAYKVAVAAAEASQNPMAYSYALGSLGKLYEDNKAYAEALALTREAQRLAQQLGAPDLIFRWTWQVGRILFATGNEEEARKAYLVAKDALQPIRHDLSIGYGNRNLGQSFREAIGSFYFELAELLLDQAGVGDASQQILVDARDVVESLKSAELEDYFQDECINVALQKRKDVDEALDDKSAVIYSIPLSQGTAILVTVGQKIHFFRSPVKGLEIERQALRMRDSIVNPETFIDYREPAQILYNGLIRPIEPLLEEKGITNLVFVPDGALRTTSMAALHDGERHLIERYAIAITPGLSLMEPRPMGEGEASMLVGALTEARHGFSALPYVADEVERIREHVSPDELINQDFLKNRVQTQVANGSFKILHIASHGQFARDSGESFFLTYDGRLSLDELEAMIRPKEFDENPVEMLCLSACKTALGDDRAALGLAGVAVKSGARSALATLWEVDDQTTSDLMAQFYANLLKGSQSRAEALRQAQLSVLYDEDGATRHPYFWAPYMIIGNWY